MIYQKLMGVSVSQDVFSFNVNAFTGVGSGSFGSVYTVPYSSGFYVVHMNFQSSYGIVVSKYDSDYGLVWIRSFKSTTNFSNFYEYTIKAAVSRRYYNGSTYEDDALYILGDNGLGLGGFIARVDADGSAGALYTDTGIDTFYDASIGGTDIIYAIGKVASSNNLFLLAFSSSDSITSQKVITNSSTVEFASICTDNDDDADAHFSYSTGSNTYLGTMEMSTMTLLYSTELDLYSGQGTAFTVTDMVSTPDPNSTYDSRILFTGFVDQTNSNNRFVMYLGYYAASGYSTGPYKTILELDITLGFSTWYLDAKNASIAYDTTNKKAFIVSNYTRTTSQGVPSPKYYYVVDKFDLDVTHGTSPSLDFSRLQFEPSRYSEYLGNVSHLTVQSDFPAILYGAHFDEALYYVLMKDDLPSTGTFDSGFDGDDGDVVLNIQNETPTNTTSSSLITKASHTISTATSSVSFTTDGNYSGSDISSTLTEYSVPIQS